MICAIAMVAVNAQNLSNRFDVAKLNNVKVVKGQSMMKHAGAPVSLSNANMQVVKNIKNLPAKAAKHNAPASSLENLEGNWIEEHTEWIDDITSFNVASQVEATMEEDEEGAYLAITGISDGYANIYGEYDPETGLMAIYPQYCYEHESYGRFAFFGLTEEGELDQDNPYMLQVEQDETGHISMVSTSENGWVILLMEGEYQGEAWTFGDELILNQPNFEFTGSETHVENNAWTGYNDFEGILVYLENIEGTAIVHGMFGTSFMLSMSEDGTEFTIPNGQPITYGWTGTEYIIFTTYNMDAFGDHWDVMMTQDDTYTPDPNWELPGYVSTTGAYVFASTERDEEGKMQWDYIYVAKFMSETSGYFKNLYAGIVLLPLEEPETGISGVAGEKKANNITFNAAGQKVNKDYKGLVIRNGQKFMNK